jgi:hypothetical protein
MYRSAIYLLVSAGIAAAAPLRCNLSAYHEQAGLRAEAAQDSLWVTWQGDHGRQLRVSFAIDNGQPLIRDMEAQQAGGEWAVLARDLKPEFHVTTGRRRISEQQLQPLRELHIALTPELIDREKWNAFWDAPLSIPGTPGTDADLPRKPDEVRRADATFNASGCQVATDGARLEVTFPGLSLGIFSGRLQYTVYKGTNLLRQEAIAKTEEPSVAYKYIAGVEGLRVDPATRVIWRDTSRGWQKYEFGGTPNRDRVALKARNRLEVVETAHGSIAVFPPPHKFFFAREIELNLGYVWYRKDNADSFSVGVRQGDREEAYKPYGVSDEEWNKRVHEARHNSGNFALYNAPPGTWQRMAVYFYLSPEPGRATQQAVMAFTRGDYYQPLPGYKVAISHFHTHFNEQLSDAGTLDLQPTWVPTFRALGVNIAMMSDFHGDGHAQDPGPLRFHDQQVYFEGCKRVSDRDFLVMPGEEPDAHFGGHYTMVFSRPVYWSKVRQPGQPLIEKDPKYGIVYHIGSEADELAMLRRENGFVWQAHPRTKGSTDYPDAVRESVHFRSDRFLGASFQSLPADLSQKRLCEVRCFGTLDDMNNWAGAKYLISEGDTYAKYPNDETYPQLMVNYVKLDRVPGPDEDWSPVMNAMRAGDFFITSGEVLLPRVAIEGSGNHRTVVADVDWTFPLDFVEVVWGDGEKTDRKVISTTDLPPFSSRQFRVPFDASGKKWVRFAAWDSAGNGAASQPVHFAEHPQP